MKTYLETARMRLREFTLDDERLLVELDSDPEVMRYVTGGVPTSIEIVRDEVLPRWMAWYDRDGEFGYWAALDKMTGEFLGWFHLRPRSDPNEVHIGYRLKRDCWGRGLATEGTRAVIRHGFDKLGDVRIVATAMAGNAASIRVMEKAGLRFVCHFIEERFIGTDKRAVKYAIDRAAHDRIARGGAT